MPRAHCLKQHVWFLPLAVRAPAACCEVMKQHCTLAFSWLKAAPRAYVSVLVTMVLSSVVVCVAVIWWLLCRATGIAPLRGSALTSQLAACFRKAARSYGPWSGCLHPLPGGQPTRCMHLCCVAARCFAARYCCHVCCCCQIGKLIYCTRTVPEMEKVLAELQASMQAP